MSATPQCSPTRPAPSNRMMSMSCTSTRVPVGGTPMNSPLCVPVTGKRGQQSPEEFERSLLRGRKICHALVLDEVVRYQVAEPGDVSRVDPLVGFPHRRSVIHGRPPSLLGCSMRYCMRSMVLAASGEDITRSSDVPRRRAQPGSIRPAWRIHAAGGCSRYAARCTAAWPRHRSSVPRPPATTPPARSK